jgi:hypothetical protein
MINSFVLQVKNLKHNDGSSLIAVMILAIIAAMVLQSVTYSSLSTLKTSGRQMSKVSSLNLAEAGKEKAIAELRNKLLTLTPGKMITCYDNISFGNGKFTVKCSTNTAGDIGFIYSTGVQGTVSTTIEVVVSIEPDSRHYWFKVC